MLYEFAIVVSRAVVPPGGPGSAALAAKQSIQRELEHSPGVPALTAAVEAWARRLAQSRLDARNVRRSSVAQAAIEFVNSNCDKPLSLADVARHVHISPFRLTRMLRQATGRSFVRYLTACRIHKARELLAGSSVTVAKVARACGYADEGYFSRVFKKDTGYRPSEFRGRR